MRSIALMPSLALALSAFVSAAPAQTAGTPGQAAPQVPAATPVRLEQLVPPPSQAAQPSQAQWLYFVSYNDTDLLGDWVTQYCGTRDPSGVNAFIAQQGDGEPYTVHLWCRADKADVEWVRDGEIWDGGSVEAVSNGLASGKVGLVGFIRSPYGDSVVWLKQVR